LVPKTVQIRDLDDEVYAALVRRAAEAGVSVPELLRASAPAGRVEVLAALDEQRGAWPDAGH